MTEPHADASTTPGTECDLSVVVAAYNESAVIAGNLHRIVEQLRTRPSVRWELLCVNDGSTDDTGRLMDAFAVDEPRARVLHHRRNFGQGRALRTAFDACRGAMIVTLDADLSYGPDYIYRLTDALAEQTVEIALASPYTRGGTVRNVPMYRHVLSRVGNWYLARMSRYPISTSTCVVRAYRREVLDAVTLTSDGMELQLEVLMKSAMMGFRVCEVPAHLEWANQKVAEADFRRVSKMRILRTIRLYLLMGWLSRPAFLFMVLSLLMILPGLSTAVAVGVRVIQAMKAHGQKGFFDSLSLGLRDVWTQYPHSIVIFGAMLMVGIQIFAFSMLLMQNKSYFEELYQLQQTVYRLHRRGRQDDPRD